MHPLTRDITVTILPGIPGQEGFRPDDSGNPYPENTPDFAKRLRRDGYNVEYTEPREQRLYVGFKANEVWLPIIEVTSQLMISVGGGLLVEVLKSYLGLNDGHDHAEGPLEISATDDELALPSQTAAPSANALLHVDWRVRDGQRVSQFLADGHPDDVIEAMTEFERSIHDGD